MLIYVKYENTTGKVVEYSDVPKNLISTQEYTTVELDTEDTFYFKEKEDYLAVLPGCGQYNKNVKRFQCLSTDLPDVAVKKWNEVRTERNNRLLNTDWIFADDAPISEELKEQYIIYRQALRDIPSNNLNPYIINWPEIPA